MKHTLTLLFLALCAARAGAQRSSSTIALSPDALDRATVYADHFETGPNGDAMIASGHVRAEIYQRTAGNAPAEPIFITAGVVKADLATGIITAEEQVRLETGGRVVVGSNATYNWQTRVGVVEAVEMEEYGLSFRADSIEIGPTRRVMRGVMFSACGLVRPDYLVHASSVTLTGDRRISARNVALDLFQHRVAVLPRLVYRVRKQQAGGAKGLPIPLPGHSQVSGFTLSQRVPMSDSVNLELEATSRVGVRGMAAYEGEGWMRPYAEADWKQERRSLGRVPVLVSRLPEIGLRFGDPTVGFVSAGYYREHSSHVRAGRLTIGLDHVVVDRGERAGVKVTVGAQASSYSTGDAYRTARAEVSVGRERRGPDVLEEIGLRENGIEGHSPFEWDQVPLQTELFVRKRLAWNRWRLETGVRYDLGHQEVYEVETAVARVFGCLTPEVRYSDRLRTVFFGLKVRG